MSRPIPGTGSLRPLPAPRGRGDAPFGGLRRAYRTPKGLMLLVLVALLALAAPGAGLATVAPGLLAAVGAAALLDAALLWWLRGELAWPSGAILSALFVALILDPRTQAYVVVWTALLAVASKYLLRTRWANVLNPAALALVANYCTFGSGQSWWGSLPDLPGPYVLLLLAGVLCIAGRLGKLPLMGTFLFGYFALCTLAAFAGDPGRVAEVFRVPDANAALFFAGFMLTGPPTSPGRACDQMAYAALVAAASVALTLALGAFWALPGGLLLGNLYETRSWLLAARRRTRARAARTVAAR